MHGCEDAAPAQGDHRQRHGHARPELPPRGRSVPRLAAQRALAAVQARGAERPERLLARASAASPIDRLAFMLSRAGLGCRRGAARPRGDGHREAPARHRRVLRRRGARRRPGAFYSAATEGRGRLVEEKEESSAVEEEGLVDVFIACVRADPEKTCACVGVQRSIARLARSSCASRTRAAAASRGVSK